MYYHGCTDCRCELGPARLVCSERGDHTNDNTMTIAIIGTGVPFALYYYYTSVNCLFGLCHCTRNKSMSLYIN